MSRAKGLTRALAPLLLVLSCFPAGQAARGGELERLVAQLKHHDARQRRMAIYRLSRLRDKRAVEPLIAALKDKDAAVRRSAASALRTLGWQPTTDVQKADYLLASGQWREAVKLGEAAVEPLIAALKYKDGSARLRATEALGNLGDKRAVEPLIALLKGQDRSMRSVAARAFHSGA